MQLLEIIVNIPGCVTTFTTAPIGYVKVEVEGDVHEEWLLDPALIRIVLPHLKTASVTRENNGSFMLNLDQDQKMVPIQKISLVSSVPLLL